MATTPTPQWASLSIGGRRCLDGACFFETQRGTEDTEKRLAQSQSLCELCVLKIEQSVGGTVRNNLIVNRCQSVGGTVRNNEQSKGGTVRNNQWVAPFIPFPFMNNQWVAPFVPFGTISWWHRLRDVEN